MCIRDRAVEKGISQSLLDRLSLSPERIHDFAEGVRQVAALPDPVGEVIDSWQTENGLHIQKVRVPIGVIGMIYEARPNVTVDSAALAIKSGNATLLRGSASALRSNQAIVSLMKDALRGTQVPPECVYLLEDVKMCIRDSGTARRLRIKLSGSGTKTGTAFL